ncbi:MAG: PEGA domain-containing protein [Patescibacteria group bacterium]|nr:PEGA domain-containing protein [Patescibacteria group bacterium]
MDDRIKKILLGLGPTVIITLGFVGWRYFTGRRVEPNAALSINLDGSSQDVWVDGELRGKTPFYSDTLRPGESTVRVASWSARLNFTPSTLTAVNLDLGQFTKEEIFWLEKSDEAKISVISEPGGAEIKMGGKNMGTTPLFSPVQPGPYDLEVVKDGYELSNLKVHVQPGYKLNAWFKLRPSIIPYEAEQIDPTEWGWEGKGDLVTLLDYSVPDPSFFASTKSWISALQDRWGDNSLEETPTYFLDQSGVVYNERGEEVEEKEGGEGRLVLAYLGDSDEDVPQAAREGLVSFLEKSFPAQSSPKVRVLPTGVGFLRVRSGSGTSYNEITKVSPGDIYPMLGTQGGWHRILLDDGREGWVSGDYVEEIVE